MAWIYRHVIDTHEDRSSPKTYSQHSIKDVRIQTQQRTEIYNQLHEKEHIQVLNIQSNFLITNPAYNYYPAYNNRLAKGSSVLTVGWIDFQLWKQCKITRNL